VQERTATGPKPYTLRVKAGGEIARGCLGKNAWDAAVRTSVPRTLDMSILSWKEQSPDAIAELREHLDRDFEYVGYHLTVGGREQQRRCGRRWEASCTRPPGCEKYGGHGQQSGHQRIGRRGQQSISHSVSREST
jgi:hypothetical protein